MTFPPLPLDPAMLELMGFAGFATYVCNYTALTFGKYSSESPVYFVANLCAASLVLAGLTVSFNLASAMIQVFFITVSLFGIALRLRRPRWRAPTKHPVADTAPSFHSIRLQTPSSRP